MTEIIIKREGCWLVIRDSKGHEMQYLYYSKRERLKRFREQFGLKHKKVDLYDWTKERI